MIRRMVTGALFAGIVAGLFAALLHFAFVQEYIFLAETYETGEAVHFAGAAPEQVQDAGAVAAEPVVTGAAVDSEGAVETAGDHDHAPGDAMSGFARNGWTVAFTVLVHVAFGLMLVAGFGLAETLGKSVTARDGLLWGIAGFVALQLAPAMGLAPELPGTLAADLGARQVWWAATALSTATGLALLGYGRGAGAVAAAVVLLAAPHLIGAPELDGYFGVTPPEVSSAFAARVLGVGLASWAALGWLSGRVWSGKSA